MVSNYRIKVIEEDRTPESFVRRIHELYAPPAVVVGAYPVRNPTLAVSSSRSISSPDIFNIRSKNSISKQLSASSSASVQSTAVRTARTPEQFPNSNDFENAPSSPNESPNCTVCDKATNTCEAVSQLHHFFLFSLLNKNTGKFRPASQHSASVLAKEFCRIFSFFLKSGDTCSFLKKSWKRWTIEILASKMLLLVK